MQRHTTVCDCIPPPIPSDATAYHRMRLYTAAGTIRHRMEKHTAADGKTYGSGWENAASAKHDSIWRDTRGLRRVSGNTIFGVGRNPAPHGNQGVENDKHLSQPCSVSLPPCRLLCGAGRYGKSNRTVPDRAEIRRIRAKRGNLTKESK